MADKKILGLPEASELTDQTAWEITQNGESKHIKGSTLVSEIAEEIKGDGSVSESNLSQAVLEKLNKSHDQNADTILDEGGDNEVTAATLKGISNHFDPTDGNKLKGSGLKDDAVSTPKVLDDNITEPKLSPELRAKINKPSDSASLSVLKPIGIIRNTANTIEQQFDLGKGVWIVYNEPRIVRYVNIKDQTYIGYVSGDSDGVNRNDIYITSLNNITGEIVTTKVFEDTSGDTGDDHINPAICIMPNGKILLMYTRHALESTIRFAISTNAEDVSSFSNYTLDPGGEASTYPILYYLSAESKYFCFFRQRVSSVDYRKSFITSSDGVNWSSSSYLFKFTPSGETGRVLPYTKAIGNGIDKIHFVITEGWDDTGTGFTEHRSLYYCYYQNGNLYKADGTLIIAVSSITDGVSRSQLEKIYDSAVTGKNTQQWDIALDENGYPVIVATEFNAAMDGTNQATIYLRYNGSTWLTTKIDDVGRHIGIESQTSVFEYSAGSAINHNNVNEVFYSKQISTNVWEIYKAVTLDNGVSFITSQATNNDAFSFRPCVVRNSDKADDFLYLKGSFSDWNEFDTNLIVNKVKTQTQISIDLSELFNDQFGENTEIVKAVDYISDATLIAASINGNILSVSLKKVGAGVLRILGTSGDEERTGVHDIIIISDDTQTESSSTTTYKKQVTLSASTQVDNYQVKLTISPSDVLYNRISDYSKLKFVSNDEATDYSHYVENWDQSGTSTIWVKVPTSGISSFKMLYGNEVLAASSGDDVFEFFDDFDTSSLDTTKWVERLPGITFSNSEAVLSFESARGLIDGLTPVAAPAILESKMRANGISPGNHHFCVFRESNNWDDRAGDLYTNANSGEVILRATVNGVHTFQNAFITGVFTDSHIFKVIWTADTVKAYQNQSLLTTLEISQPNNQVAALYEPATVGDGIAYVDWVRIRKYQATEPTITLSEI